MKSSQCVSNVCIESMGSVLQKLFRKFALQIDVVWNIV